MDLGPARTSAPALLLLASACSGEAQAPAIPTQPPTVVISAPVSTSNADLVVRPAEPAITAPAPEAAPTATAEAPAVGDVGTTRSSHRGTVTTNYGRWRPTIENYAPSVKVGNTTALNAARVPFATYLVAVHNRIHPLFADQFLGSLGNLPAGRPLNGDLSVHLEIVLGKDTGKIVRMGVTKASGVTAFDVAALDAVGRAAPFGKAPDAIASPDGNVYLHWEFHRDPIDACTTRNARPYILKTAP